MKIVVDTNVIVSAIFFGGRPKDLLVHLVSHEIDVYASTEIIEEYKDTVEYLCSKYPERPHRLPLTEIVSAMRIVKPSLRIEVCRDPDDNKFIECAYEAKCIFVVSGDKDLLSLKRFKNIEIVTVAKFLSEYIGDNV